MNIYGISEEDARVIIENGERVERAGWMRNPDGKIRTAVDKIIAAMGGARVNWSCSSCIAKAFVLAMRALKTQIPDEVAKDTEDDALEAKAQESVAPKKRGRKAKSSQK